MISKSILRSVGWDSEIVSFFKAITVVKMKKMVKILY